MDVCLDLLGGIRDFTWIKTKVYGCMRIPVTARLTRVVLSIIGAHLLQMAWLQGNNTPCKMVSSEHNTLQFINYTITASNGLVKGILVYRAQGNCERHYQNPVET